MRISDWSSDVCSSDLSGELRPLSGVPLGIKDLFATKGVQTTAASQILEGFTPPYESTVTAKLFAAGAGMLGKLNLDQFAMGSSNETSSFGTVISPWRRPEISTQGNRGKGGVSTFRSGWGPYPKK